MTRKIHVHLIDDLDASEASETVRFEVDGRPYEIDLSSHNAQRFRADIAPYIAHARKVVTYGHRRRASLGRPRGVAPATRRGGVTPSRGHVAGVTADEETSAGDAGSLSPWAGPGSDMHHTRPPARESDDKEPGPF
jgi:hypothetical protein